ncbi:DNA/RNA non-specific endonuclease [Atopobiaceae bacterium 24-176]
MARRRIGRRLPKGRVWLPVVIGIVLAAALCGPWALDRWATPDCGKSVGAQAPQGTVELAEDGSVKDVGAYDGELVVSVDDGLADFGADSGRTDAFETYAALDDEGRCGAAYANVCRETMPTGEREPISEVKPTGWRQASYPWVDGEKLYNRCHLIAWSLTGENANERNLVTGTRTMNAESMVAYETQVADHVRRTSHHVLYRATPVFAGDEEVCRGVRLEARCVEGDGELSFDVFCHNVEPGVSIDYATGASKADGTRLGASGAMAALPAPSADTQGAEQGDYVLNVRSRKFHRPDCPGLSSASPNNLERFSGSRAELVEDGYAPCGTCRP